MRIAMTQFYDLTKALFVQGIRYEFNHNTKKLKVMGRDPAYDVYLECYLKIPNEKLYDDKNFKRWAVSEAKLSMSRLLKMYAFPLPGNVPINVDDLKAEAQAELEELKAKFIDLNQPNFILVYH